MFQVDVVSYIISCAISFCLGMLCMLWIYNGAIKALENEKVDYANRYNSLLGYTKRQISASKARLDELKNHLSNLHNIDW